MYHFSNSTKQAKVYSALAAQSREFSNRITFGYYDSSQSKPYPFVAQHTVCELAECSIEQSACAGEKMTMGGALSASLNATFTAREATVNGEDKTLTTANFITNYAYKGKIAFVECGVKYDYDQENEKDLFFYVPCGYYVITEAESDNEWKTVKITGYDYIGSVMDDQKNTYNISTITAYVYGTNSSDCLPNRIASEFGIGCKRDSNSLARYWNYASGTYQQRQITSDEQNALTGLTWREALSRVCGLVGCYARINTEGKLTFNFFSVPLSQERITITPTLQYQDGFKKLSDNVFTISSITSNNNESGNDNTYTAGNGAGLSFANPLILHNDIDGILVGLNAYTDRGTAYNIKSFLPCEVLWRGNPCVEAGDVVTVTYGGNSYTVFVAKQVTDLVGGLSQKITCPVADEEIRFDTGDWVTQQELASNINDVRTALADATAAINGADGGYIQINDKNNDGNPDEILITQVEGGASGNVIRLNSQGIGLSTNGDVEVNYTVAITGAGISAAVINSGTLNADRIGAGAISSDKIASDAITADKIASGTITADKMDIGGLVDNDLPAFSFLSGGNRLSRWDAGFKKISDTPVAKFCYSSNYDGFEAYYFKITNDEQIKQQREYWADFKLDCPEGEINGDYCFSFIPFADSDFEGANEIKVTLYVISEANQTYMANRFGGLDVTVDGNEQSVTATYNRTRITQITAKLKEITITPDDLDKKKRIRFPLAQYSLLEHEYFMISIDIKAYGKNTASYYGVKDLAIGKYVEGETVVAGKMTSYVGDTIFDLDNATLLITQPNTDVVNSKAQMQAELTYDYLKFDKDENNTSYGLYSKLGVELYDYSASGHNYGYMGLTTSGGTYNGVGIISNGSKGGNIFFAGDKSPRYSEQVKIFKYDGSLDPGAELSANIYARFYNANFRVNCDAGFYGETYFDRAVSFDSTITVDGAATLSSTLTVSGAATFNEDATFNDYATFDARATFNYGLKSDDIYESGGSVTILSKQNSIVYVGDDSYTTYVLGSRTVVPSQLQLGNYLLEAKSDGLYYANRKLAFA